MASSYFDIFSGHLSTISNLKVGLGRSNGHAETESVKGVMPQEYHYFIWLCVFSWFVSCLL